MRYRMKQLFAPALLLAAGPMLSRAATTYYIPNGLTTGEEFQLVFLADNDYYSVTSSNIATYNTDVTDDAESSGSMVKSMTVALGIQWKAIVSTGAESAATNIGTSTVPIYNLYGQVVANGTAGLWSGSLVNAIQYSEDGYLTQAWTYTGTNSNGSIDVGYALGDTNVQAGDTYDTDYNWVAGGPALASDEGFFFAISPVLIVTGPKTVALAPLVTTPEPSSGMLAGIGLALVGIGAVRRHDYHKSRSRS